MGVQQIAPLPDEKTTELFMRTVFDRMPAGARVIIWTLPDKITRTFTDVDEAIAYVGECVAHKDVYFGVGTGSKDLEPNARFKAREVTSLTGFHIDVDVEESGGHKKKGLPPTKEAAWDFIMSLDIEPTLVVDTGHGYHAHWLFEEPMVLENSAERDTIRQRFRWWQQYARGKGLRDHGWASTVDPTADLARILRVPGTVNWKIPAEPLSVNIVHYNPQARYTIDQFLDVLQANQEIAQLPSNDLNADMSRRDLEGTLTFNRDAEPNALKFGRLMRDSKLAYDAFYHNDSELPSASEEDYKLACAAFRQMSEGEDGMVHRTWSAQEVVDLLVYHRNTYGYDLKRPDYYARTVAKALADVTKDDKVTDATAALDEHVAALHTALTPMPEDGDASPFADDEEADAEVETDTVEETEVGGYGVSDLSSLMDEDDGVKFTPDAQARLLRRETSSPVTPLAKGKPVATATATKVKTKTKASKGETGILALHPADMKEEDREQARQNILAGLTEIYAPIEFVDIVKLLSDPPQYRFTFRVRGKETSLTVKSLDAVVNISQFRVAVAGATDQLMPKLKGWDKHVQAILTAARPEEIGEEATAIGLVNGWLNGYVESAAIDHDWDGQWVDDGNRTIIPYKGEHYLLMNDIIYWLRVHRNERTSPQALGALFRERGLTLEKIPMMRGKNRTTKSVWWIPNSIMAPFLEAEEKFKV